MSATTKCPHTDVHFNIHHQGFTDSNVNYLEITAICNICQIPMVFRGNMPLGVTPAHPTVSLDGREIRLPFLGEGEKPEGKIIGLTGRQIA